jgi:hypothetical protein
LARVIFFSPSPKLPLVIVVFVVVVDDAVA